MNYQLILFFSRCSARFLWKRVPPITKNGNTELEKIWKIYNTLWNNNVESFFKNINYEWSTNVAELMFELKGTYFFLIAKLDTFNYLLLLLLIDGDYFLAGK